MAEADYYLQIEGIKGESLAKEFTDAIQVESWSDGASNSGSSTVGQGLGTGKVSLQDFHFVTQCGTASLQMYLHTCKGTHFKEAILSCRKTGGNGEPYTYLKVTFNDLVFSSYQTGGSNGSNTLPMDQISFNYTKITKQYFMQKEDGTVSQTNNVTYDTKAVSGSGA
jgi:type VI secretion system secreted protein Hcp